jgi:branched-chain amino acid transport system substrate-binding protein
MKKMFRYLTLFCGIILFFCGCVEHTQNIPVKKNGPVLIGALLPLTGADKIRGERMLSGLQYAEYELNSQRGINNRNVKLLVFDSEAEGAYNAYLAAVKSGVSGIICGNTGDELPNVFAPAEQYNIPTVIARDTADSNVNANASIFRSIYTDKQQSESLAAYLWYWRQMQRICVLMDNSPEAVSERNNARAVAESFRDLGGTVTDTPVYRENNFSKAVNEALITGPQAIIVSARGKRAAAILAELRQKGYKGAICGTDGWDTPEFFKSLMVKDPGDCVYISRFTPSETSEEFKDFSAGFRRRHFHEPGDLETISYDAFKLLSIGLGRAETLRDFRKNWQSIRNHFGCGATYTMLKRGKVDRTMYINAIEPAKENGIGCQGRLLRSFMHSKLATYRY